MAETKDGSQQEITRQLVRLESQLARIEKRVDFLSAVVSTVLVTVLVLLGGWALLSLLGGMVFAGKSHFVFPAAVVGLFAITMLIKRLIRR